MFGCLCLSLLFLFLVSSVVGLFAFVAWVFALDRFMLFVGVAFVCVFPCSLSLCVCYCCVVFCVFWLMCVCVFPCVCFVCVSCVVLCICMCCCCFLCVFDF